MNKTRITTHLNDALSEENLDCFLQNGQKTAVMNADACGKKTKNVIIKDTNWFFVSIFINTSSKQIKTLGNHICLLTSNSKSLISQQITPTSAQHVLEFQHLWQLSVLGSQTGEHLVQQHADLGGVRGRKSEHLTRVVKLWWNKSQCQIIKSGQTLVFVSPKNEKQT